MKTLKSIITILLFTFGTLNLCAVANKSLNIITKDRPVSFFLDEIQEINHFNGNIEIKSVDNTYSYSLQEVEAISWPEDDDLQLFELSPQALEGWEQGYINNNGCFAVARPNQENGYDLVLGVRNSLEDAMFCRFDDNFELQSIFSGNASMNLCQDEEGNQFYVILSDDDIKIIEKEETYNFESSYSKPYFFTRSVPLNSIFNALGWIMTKEDITRNLLPDPTGYFSTFCVNLTPTLLGFAGMSACSSFGLSVMLSYYEYQYDKYYEEMMNHYFANASVQITNINDENRPDYKIEVTVDGISNLNLNKFHSGVAVKIDDSNVSYQNCDYRLKDHQIPNHEAYTADITLKNKTHYWSRPYIVVMALNNYYPIPITRQKYLFGGPDVHYIIHGNPVDLYYEANPSASTGELVSKTKNSAVVKCSFQDVKGYECGVIVYNDEGEYSTFSTSSTEGEREIQITGLSPLTLYYYNAYVMVDGQIKSSVPQSFVTDGPNISGTWNCTRYPAPGSTDKPESYRITLHPEGGVSCSLYDHLEGGSWSLGAKGVVSIGVMTIATNTANAGTNWDGTLNNLDDANVIEGYVYNWNFNQVGYFQHDSFKFVMTR